MLAELVEYSRNLPSQRPHLSYAFELCNVLNSLTVNRHSLLSSTGVACQLMQFQETVTVPFEILAKRTPENQHSNGNLSAEIDALLHRRERFSQLLDTSVLVMVET